MGDPSGNGARIEPLAPGLEVNDPSLRDAAGLVDEHVHVTLFPAMRQRPSREFLGVPAVAIGITLSAFGVRLAELLSALFLGGACLLTVAQQLRLASHWPRSSALAIRC